jgi:hypothetical protein
MDNATTDDKIIIQGTIGKTISDVADANFASNEFEGKMFNRSY